jgi:hypothetical protein
MKGNIPVAWLVMAVCLSSCGGSTTSQYMPAPAAAPNGLSYPDPNLFIQGVPIPTLFPTVTGTPTNYFVDPELPAGLTLASNGQISGTPTEPKSPETYLVTAGNAAGTTSFGIRITIIGRFTIGGTVSGLTGTGLVLTNNGGDNLAVNANGAFIFNTTLPAGSIYLVEVATQPTGQSCSIAQGSGTLANDDHRVVVSCSANTPKATVVKGAPANHFQALAIDNLDRVLYLACFDAPPRKFQRGYSFDQASGLVTLQGHLLHEFPASATASRHCEASSLQWDPRGPWLYVTDVLSNTTSVYSAVAQ